MQFVLSNRFVNCLKIDFSYIDDLSYYSLPKYQEIIRKCNDHQELASISWHQDDSAIPIAFTFLALMKNDRI